MKNSDANPESGDVEAVADNCWPAGVSIRYQVRAWNSAGAGLWSSSSEPMQISLPQPDAPAAPTLAKQLPKACSFVSKQAV